MTVLAVLASLIFGACNVFAPERPLRACGEYPVYYPLQSAQRNAEVFYAERILPIWNSQDITRTELRAVPFLSLLREGESVHEIIRSGTLGPHVLARQFADTFWTHADEVRRVCPT